MFCSCQDYRMVSETSLRLTKQSQFFFAIICHHLCLIAHKQTIRWNLFVRFEFTKYEGKIKTNSKLPLQRSTQVKLLSFTNSYILSWLENTIFSFKNPFILNYFYKSYFWLQFLKLDAESVNKKFEIICKWMRQLIVKLRPGSHQGSFGQLSVKRGLLSVITTRFLMRTMFYKFLKILEILRKLQRHRSVWWGRQILGKKQDTDSGAVNASHLTHMWPAVKLLMFSFLLFAIFLLTTRWDHSQCKIFLIFTLHWLRSDQAGPMGILSNRCSSYYSTIFNSSASVVCDTNSLTNSRSAKGWKEKDDSQAEKQKKNNMKNGSKKNEGF